MKKYTGITVNSHVSPRAYAILHGRRALSHTRRVLIERVAG